MSLEYKYVIDNDNHYYECNSCNREVPVYPFRTDRVNKPKHKYQLFCEICATTFIGNHHTYHHTYQHNWEKHDITGAIAAVGNIIRNDLGIFKEAGTVCIGDHSNWSNFINNPFSEGHWFEK